MPLLLIKAGYKNPKNLFNLIINLWIVCFTSKNLGFLFHLSKLLIYELFVLPQKIWDFCFTSLNFSFFLWWPGFEPRTLYIIINLWIVCFTSKNLGFLFHLSKFLFFFVVAGIWTPDLVYIMLMLCICYGLG
jgi:hypothetical protein